MALARLVLLEDDASIRRFVAMALEDAPIELVECETVAEALAALRAGPVTLVITDLMLRDESGFDLLQAVHDEPALLGDGRVAVFSAGLAANVMSQLQRFQVWRMLSKPASLAQLDACVADALAEAAAKVACGVADPGGTGPDAAATPAPAPATAPSAVAATPPATPPAPALQAAVDEHFGGDQALFQGYREACLVQFPRDIDEGDQALAAGDTAALRRLSHSLRTVLQMIAQPGLAARAAELDDAAARLEADRLPALWQAVREGLGELTDRG